MAKKPDGTTVEDGPDVPYHETEDGRKYFVNGRWVIHDGSLVSPPAGWVPPKGWVDPLASANPDPAPVTQK